MKRTGIVCLFALLTTQVFADAGQRLIPAGSLVSCTTGDARISSKTTAIGDPVLCKVEHRRGDFMLPYGSYLGGEFAEFKDPGHFVGKGWMQLDFDRLYVGDEVVGINAKVVDVPGYKIDSQGRILGKGHEARDIALWSIPVLWPVDLLMLPMRGPRPVLKTETAVTLRVMEDIEVPVIPEPQRDPNGLIERTPNAYAPQPEPPAQEPYQSQENAYVPEQQAAPPPMAYAVPAPYPAFVPYPAPVIPAPVVVPPPVVAWGGVVVGPGRAVVGYGPRAYVGGPAVRAYGYAPGAYAPSVGVRAYSYGYGGRGAVAGSYAMRGYAGGGYAARGGFAGGARVR